MIWVLVIIAACLLVGGAAVGHALLIFLGIAAGGIALGLLSWSVGVSPILLFFGTLAVVVVAGYLVSRHQRTTPAQANALADRLDEEKRQREQARTPKSR